MTPRHIEVLDELILRVLPSFLSALHTVGVRGMHPRQREQLHELLANELQMTGFRPDWEPNARGLIIEDLIDWVGIPEDGPPGPLEPHASADRHAD